MNMDDEDKFAPSTKPAFLDKDRAESIGYIGAGPDAFPSFDNEITPLPELEGDNPPRGNGPTKGYETRWREIARLHSLGYTNNQIARHLGYSATGISLALNQPFVQTEVARCRELFFNQDIVNIVKDTAKDGAVKLRQMLNDPRTKESTVVDIAKFSIEKSTGKAKQEVSVESGTFASFMELLKEKTSRGEPIDVTPESKIKVNEDKIEPETKSSDWNQWIEQNIK